MLGSFDMARSVQRSVTPMSLNSSSARLDLGSVAPANAAMSATVILVAVSISNRHPGVLRKAKRDGPHFRARACACASSSFDGSLFYVIHLHALPADCGMYGAREPIASAF